MIYRAASAPYSALAEIYDRWMADVPYDQWCEFIDHSLQVAGIRVERVLDLCCGTGAIAGRLARRGYSVTGMDGSQEMLHWARRKFGDVLFYKRRLPSALPLGARASFDAITCCFDSLNYVWPASDLRAVFANVAFVLRAGGRFVFDLNSRYKMEVVLGNSRTGNDFGSGAYIWRNSYDTATSRLEATVSVFVESDGLFVKHIESHSQAWFHREVVEDLLHNEGFEVVAVCDDYTLNGLSEATQRETWVAQRRD